MAKRRSAANASLGAGILFIAVGLIFFFVCLFLTIDTKKFAETAQETSALVYDVQKERVRRNGKYRTDYDVYVQYKVNGVTYNEELNGGSSLMREGQTLIVYYNPENPRDVRSDKNAGVQSFAMIFSLVFVAVGAVVGVVPAVKLSKRKKLKETGEQGTAIITNVDIDRSVRINKRHPYKAQCEFTDPVTGEKYLYSSEGVMSDIRHLQGQLVTVYYDPADRSRYYVDLDSVDENVMGGTAVHDFR